MPLGGLLPYGVGQAAMGAGGFPQGQMQTVAEPFVYGAGGRRLTPQDIAREREIAAAMMQTDYSPIASPWQGLARVSENVLGGLRQRSANKAQDVNRTEDDARIAALLGNAGGAIPAGGGPGAFQSSASGPNIAAILASPYAGEGVRALAKRQLDLQDARAKAQIGSEFAEPTETARLAREAYPNDPAKQSAFIQSVARNKEDPFVNVIGNPDFGTYAGRQSGLNAILGAGAQPQPQAMDAPDTLPADFFDAGPPSISAAPPRVSEASALATARAEGDEYLRRILGGRR